MVSVPTTGQHRAYVPADSEAGREALFAQSIHSSCGLTQWLNRYRTVLPEPAVKLAERLIRMLEKVVAESAKKAA